MIPLFESSDLHDMMDDVTAHPRKTTNSSKAKATYLKVLLKYKYYVMYFKMLPSSFIAARPQQDELYCSFLYA